MEEMKSGPKAAFNVDQGTAAATWRPKITIRGRKSGFRIEWCIIGVYYGVLVAP